jgi:hypothetical protein
MCGAEAVAGNHEVLAPVLGRAGNDVLAPSGRGASEPKDDGGVDATIGVCAVGGGVDESLARAKVAPLDEVAVVGSHLLKLERMCGSLRVSVYWLHSGAGPGDKNFVFRLNLSTDLHSGQDGLRVMVKDFEVCDPHSCETTR